MLQIVPLALALAGICYCSGADIYNIIQYLSKNKKRAEIVLPIYILTIFGIFSVDGRLFQQNTLLSELYFTLLFIYVLTTLLKYFVFNKD